MGSRLALPLMLLGFVCMGAYGTELSPPPGSEAPLPVQRIVAGLPWRFDVSTTRRQAAEPLADDKQPASAARITHQFVSAKPYRSTAQGLLFLRAELTLDQFDTPPQAEQAFTRIAAEAHPDMGLSYAWDHLILSDHSLLHLHASCAFSEPHFLQMVGELEKLAGPGEAGNTRALQCRCGGGCKALPMPPTH
jgi:hypothetical protein